MVGSRGSEWIMDPVNKGRDGGACLYTVGIWSTAGVGSAREMGFQSLIMIETRQKRCQGGKAGNIVERHSGYDSELFC